jgi:hypothetical protein
MVCGSPCDAHRKVCASTGESANAAHAAKATISLFAITISVQTPKVASSLS